MKDQELSGGELLLGIGAFFGGVWVWRNLEVVGRAAAASLKSKPMETAPPPPHCRTCGAVMSPPFRCSSPVCRPLRARPKSTRSVHRETRRQLRKILGLESSASVLRQTPERLALNPAPPASVEQTITPTPEIIKKRRGGSEKGWQSRQTRNILCAYDEHRAAGIDDERARERVAAKLSPKLFKGIKEFRRAVDTVIKKYRDDGFTTVK
jgi:hypothetical protein